MRRRAWAVGVAAAALAGCGGEEAPPSPAAASGPVATAPQRTSEGEVVEIRGVVIGESDVGGIPDHRLSSGVVVVAPATALGDLSARAAPDDLARGRFSLARDDLEAIGAAVAPIDVEGRFSSQGVAADIVVCLADHFLDHEPGPPYSVTGCAGPVSAAADLRVLFGRGGVAVTES